MGVLWTLAYVSGLYLMLAVGGSGMSHGPKGAGLLHFIFVDVILRPFLHPVAFFTFQDFGAPLYVSSDALLSGGAIAFWGGLLAAAGIAFAAGLIAGRKRKV